MGNSKPEIENGVSCLCLTYGRAHLLEEAIESFLRQKWDGKKELIVLNDHSDQKLIFDHRDVMIVNLPRRIKTLGEKRNLSVALANYTNLFIWDDDDIYLPWRIEETMKTLPTKHFFKCPNAWVMNNGVLDKKPGFNLFHGATAYTRWLFEKSGGYSMMNGGEDADIENKFQHVTDIKGEYWHHTQLPHHRLFYIYRWEHGSYHTTGHTSLENIKPNVKAGEYHLKPQWHQDYEEISRVAAGVKKSVSTMSDKEVTPINFICFSKNRPLQLDGYIRSYEWALKQENGSIMDLSVLYACDKEYENAYNDLISKYNWVTFKRETHFLTDLLSLFNSSDFTAFGCDDAVFIDKVDICEVIREMDKEDHFAFSLRLGKNISKSMFSGQLSLPNNVSIGHLMTWDLHKAHAFGDFGYSWELVGTIYPTNIAFQVVQESKSNSPNTLEASGGGKWSSKTKKSLMSCFEKSKIVVATVNVVQSNFPNPVLCNVSTNFLLDAWNCGMRLDIDRYRSVTNDCIHIPDLYLSNR